MSIVQVVCPVVREGEVSRSIKKYHCLVSVYINVRFFDWQVQFIMMFILSFASHCPQEIQCPAPSHGSHVTDRTKVDLRTATSGDDVKVPVPWVTRMVVSS